MNWLRFLFSFKGRTNRAKFWLLLLLVVLYTNGVQSFAIGGIGFQFQSWQLEMSINLSVLVLIYAMVAVSAKRLHDQDRYAKWLLVYFGVPVVFSVIAGILAPQAVAHVTPATLPYVHGLAGWCTLGYLVSGWTAIAIIGVPRGTRGPNRFGPDPLAAKASSPVPPA